MRPAPNSCAAFTRAGRRQAPFKQDDLIRKALEDLAKPNFIRLAPRAGDGERRPRVSDDIRQQSFLSCLCGFLHWPWRAYPTEGPTVRVECRSGRRMLPGSDRKPSTQALYEPAIGILIVDSCYGMPKAVAPASAG
ncbi:hypothetical protein MPLSOD_260019 [Mesorhizobium sp. SOD10]|nr:hypothetical protein MPLSOD_260019 [Mesorhizobium sp. SOD10]